MHTRSIEYRSRHPFAIVQYETGYAPQRNPNQSKSWATIGPPAKRHLNVVSLDRYWSVLYAG